MAQHSMGQDAPQQGPGQTGDTMPQASVCPDSTPPPPPPCLLLLPQFLFDPLSILCYNPHPPPPPTLLLLPVQHRGLSPLLRLLASASAAVQYNAAYALYELSEAREHGLIICQAGGLQQLYSCSQRLQVSEGRDTAEGGGGLTVTAADCFCRQEGAPVIVAGISIPLRSCHQ